MKTFITIVALAMAVGCAWLVNFSQEAARATPYMASVYHSLAGVGSTCFTFLLFLIVVIWTGAFSRSEPAVADKASSTKNFNR